MKMDYRLRIFYIANYIYRYYFKLSDKKTKKNLIANLLLLFLGADMKLKVNDLK